MIKGSCFCESVTFAIDIDKIEAYHCHCSICRKVTGSKFNTATVVPAETFQWTSSTESIKCFQKNGEGFRNFFCGNCGCTVPNYYQEVNVWIPVGLLDDQENIQVVKHIFVDSKADWNDINDDLPQFSEYE